MYKKVEVAVVVPCYNEEKLVKKTINTLPKEVDHIIAVNDASTDGTLFELKEIAKTNKKVFIINNERNGGIGYSLIQGYKYALKQTKSDVIGIVAGDAQCDPDYILPMLDIIIDEKIDYIKANRFFHLEALKAMPKYRKMGNIFISLLTKFSTGYYTISDTQNGYGFLSRHILQTVNYSLVKERYDYENTMLVALSIANAKVKDFPVPAIYGDEVSTINFVPTAMRALRAVWVGFWQRIYYKYILYSFHPIALFLFSGLLLLVGGSITGALIALDRIINGVSPSTGTVMLVALPLLVGFQLLLAAITMDMNNEGKP